MLTMTRNRRRSLWGLAPLVLPVVVGFAFSGALAACALAQSDQHAAEAPAPSTQTPDAPAPVTLVGIIRAAKGVAVPGATVRAQHVPSGQRWETTTDEQGRFSFPNVPSGQYHVEVQLLGVGTAVWDNEVTPASGQVGTLSQPIEIRLHRKDVVGQQGAAESQGPESGNPSNTVPNEVVKKNADSGDSDAQAPKKHHKAGTAEEPAGAVTAGLGHSASAIESGSTRTLSKANSAANVAAPPAKNSGSGKGTEGKGPRTNKGGFQQVEPDGTLTASADTGQEAPPSTSASGTASSETADAYLISGAVGRGSTASGADATSEDDFSASDSADGSGAAGKTKKAKHQSSGKRTHKSNNGLVSSDNLAGGVADLSVRDTVKHLGSNQMHETLYNYYDTSAWDARPYAINGGPTDKMAYFSERFGINLGGPLSIPKIYNGKERTFWFANYELNRRTNPVDLYANVPTASERDGNFCDRGSQLQLFDPLTGGGGPRQTLGCSLPTTRLDNAAVKLVSLMPLPNLPGFENNYHRYARSPQGIDIANFRVLHTLSQRFSVSAVYNFLSARSEILTAFPSLEGNRETRDQNVTLTFTQNWSPRLSNETRLNFSRSRNQALSTNAFTNDLASQFGITGVSEAPIDFGVPSIQFANFQAFADPAPVLVRNQTVRLMDNITYTVAKHTFRAGAEVRRRELNSYTDPNGRGAYAFSGLMTSQLDSSGNSIPNTGLDFADFLLGLPEGTNVQFGIASNYGRQWQYSGYALDDWRVKPRFSVNYGVRYELFDPLVEKYGHLAGLIVNPQITQVAVAVPGQANAVTGLLPDSLIHPNYTDFSPRLGIAWQPFPRGGPVIRAGYGIFYNGAVLDQIYNDMIQQPPWAQAHTLVTSTSQLLTLENGFPATGVSTITNTAGVDPNFKVGYAQIWNLSLEQQLGNQYVIELLYTGTKGTHLELVSDPNEATPGSVLGSDQRRRIANASAFLYDSSGGDSIYNGLQARFQRRMSNGLRFQFLYTLGHSIDDASVIGARRATGIVQDFTNLGAERGDSSFDIRNDIRSTFGYDLPFGDRRRWLRGGAGAKLLGNWQVMGTTEYASGTHLTPYVTGQNANGVGPLSSQRPDIIGDPNLPVSQQTVTRFFNPAAFVLPPVGQFGDAPRGSIVGPAMFNVNLALNRRMHFGPDDKYTFEVRWETQNFTNTANFSNVVTIVNAKDAGLVTSAKPMRTMDILMRLHF